MRKLFMIYCLVSLCATAGADSFRGRLAQGHALLRAGDVQGALTAYRDLQTDDPESRLLYYSMGRAQYEKGMNELTLEAPQDALLSFGEALEAFDKAKTSPDERLDADATYSAANCKAQMAKLTAQTGDHEKAIAAFEESTAAYEDFLRNHPDHSGAKTNLEHMRYYLKKMLQKPPPPPEQQEQQENFEETKEPDNAEGEDQESKQNSTEQSEEEQEQPGQDQQQPPQAAQDETGQPEEEQEQADEESKPQDQQTIEALLQSLEEVDKREQQDAPRQPSGREIQRDWW